MPRLFISAIFHQSDISSTAWKKHLVDKMSDWSKIALIKYVASLSPHSTILSTFLIVDFWKFTSIRSVFTAVKSFKIDGPGLVKLRTLVSTKSLSFYFVQSSVAVLLSRVSTLRPPKKPLSRHWRLRFSLRFEHAIW